MVPTTQAARRTQPMHSSAPPTIKAIVAVDMPESSSVALLRKVGLETRRASRQQTSSAPATVGHTPLPDTPPPPKTRSHVARSTHSPDSRAAASYVQDVARGMKGSEYTSPSRLCESSGTAAMRTRVCTPGTTYSPADASPVPTSASAAPEYTSKWSTVSTGVGKMGPCVDPTDQQISSLPSSSSPSTPTSRSGTSDRHSDTSPCATYRSSSRLRANHAAAVHDATMSAPMEMYWMQYGWPDAVDTAVHIETGFANSVSTADTTVALAALAAVAPAPTSLEPSRPPLEVAWTPRTNRSHAPRLRHRGTVDRATAMASSYSENCERR
mmetsp:Transcript_2355/g.7490  ORF Transcript_2355/g.7490 Transcript_2355/m.7490 type:complete len:326 (+) Transcript_2355:191-1168(+)